ncbi:MAG: heterocyst-inhibiting protein PatX [Gloeotrichia echinulata GP01]
MRAAISLLVSGLVFGSLALNCQGMVYRFSNLRLSPSASQQMLSVKPKPKANQPEKPAPHRGSGRRELMEYYGNIHPAV